MKSFNKYKEIEITSCILSGHHGLKLNNINRNGRKYENQAAHYRMKIGSRNQKED